ncbi:MAG TPA: hypothetical protein VEC19_11800 [Usitatibacter sp.]|nr:hypothetical protein [Usitatibacter sp.]
MPRLVACVLFCLGLASSAGAQTTATQTYQGIWWAAPAGSESGWGINLTHQGDVIFATWFTYDSGGRALWLVSSLVREGDGSYSGDFFRTKGPPYSDAAFDSARVNVAKVGNGQLRFQSPTSATFTYDINGLRGSKSLTPQVFRWMPTCSLGPASRLETTINRSGLWWAAPSGTESGWGLNLVHQGNSIFLTWFTYDSDSEPLWLVATLEPHGIFWGGILYRATGPGLGTAFNPSAVSLTQVGVANLGFGYEIGLPNDNLAEFNYGVGDVIKTKRLTQQVFRDTPTTCDVSYPQQFVRDAMRAANVTSIATGLDFARKFRLSSFQLAYLLGTGPLDVVRHLRQNQIGSLPGGAKLEGYGMTMGDMIEVPADLSRLQYPADFNAAPRSLTLSDPFCDPTPATLAFPAAYVGTQPLPSVNRPATMPSFRRVAWFKDIWSKPNPNFVPGCRGDTRDAFKRTLARMKQLNIQVVTLTPWTIFDRSSSAWRVMNPAELNTSTMSDADLEWAVGEAKAQGFSVIWRSQIQGAAAGLQDTSFPASTPANVLASFSALETYLEERGAFLQRIGVDAVSMPYGYWADFEAVVGTATYLERTKRLLESLRRAFRGFIWFDWSPRLAADASISALIDGYVGSVVGPIQSPITVGNLKNAYVPHIAEVRRSAGTKPIQWLIDVASRQDVFTTGYLEESFCTGGYGLEGSNAVGCVQETKVTDFGLQAIAHEAALEAVFEADPQLHGVAVHLWMDDNVMASTAFPNIATSIRGKPAEAIVYRWFNP